MRWLRERPKRSPAIHGVAAYEPTREGVTRTWQLRVPPQTQFIISDTPAAIAECEIFDRVAETDVVLIPVLPSAIDIHSTADFIRDILLIGKARARNKRLAIIANRTRIRTKAMAKLERFLDTLDIPVIAWIRDTQHYVTAAEKGLGIHELQARDAAQDEVAWAEVLEWLKTTRQADSNTASAGPSPALQVLN